MDRFLMVFLIAFGFLWGGSQILFFFLFEMP